MPYGELMQAMNVLGDSGLPEGGAGRAGAMREAARWIGAFVFVAGLHAGAIRIALGWATAEVLYARPAAIMLELVPLPAAPRATPNEAPPGPS